MNRITILGREYCHEVDREGWDVLTYTDEASRETVVLKFPQASRPGITEQILEVLSDSFIETLFSFGE